MAPKGYKSQNTIVEWDRQDCRTAMAAQSGKLVRASAEPSSSDFVTRLCRKHGFLSAMDDPRAVTSCTSVCNQTGRQLINNMPMRSAVITSARWGFLQTMSMQEPHGQD